MSPDARGTGPEDRAPLSILALTKSTGGLSFYNHRLLEGLAARGFSSTTICLSDEGDAYAGRLRASGLDAEVMPMERYAIDPGGDLRLLRHVVRRVRALRPDVILMHGSKPGFLGRLAGRITGTPAVYRQASAPFLWRIQGARAPLYWGLERTARLFGGEMVALSEGARQATLRWGVMPRDRITLIRTGIDTAAFAPRGRRDATLRELGLDPDRPVVGWLGRMEPQKAPLDFVAAVSGIAARHPDAQFVMGGTGRLEGAAREAVARAGLTDRLHLLGWQSDMARILEAFDVFVLSSLWEGLPIALLEAMAAGCVPVSTTVDGCVDVVRDGVDGRLVAPGDPAALGAAISDVLSDPAGLDAMAAAARDRVCREFDRERMLAEWSRLLTRLAARRPAGRPDLAETRA